ncbi:MAG: N-acetyltransferase family protein [Candidatus Limnocylindria bacterium]
MDAQRPRIRPVRAGDADAIASFYANLTPESRRTRFLGSCRSISDLQAQRFARAPEHGASGWLALDQNRTAVGHLCLEPLGPGGEGVEEIAVAVAEEWRGHGLGRALLDAAIASARHRGVRALEATMLTGNHPIHALLEHAGLPWTCHALEPGSETIRIDLRREAVLGAA